MEQQEIPFPWGKVGGGGQDVEKVSLKLSKMHKGWWDPHKVTSFQSGPSPCHSHQLWEATPYAQILSHLRRVITFLAHINQTAGRKGIRQCIHVGVGHMCFGCTHVVPLTVRRWQLCKRRPIQVVCRKHQRKREQVQFAAWHSLGAGIIDVWRKSFSV